MNIKDIIQEAITSLRINIKRTFLTVLGIVIGIFAVTVMLALGDGVKQSIGSSISSFADGDVSISVTNEKNLLLESDVNWVRSQPYVKETLAINMSGSPVVGNNEKFNPILQSVLGNYQNVKKITLVAGESFDWNDSEYLEKVVVVDTQFEKKFKEKTKKTSLNQVLTIQSQNFKVIGIIKMGSAAGFGDGYVRFPSATMNQFITGKNGYNKIDITLKNSDYYTIVSDHLQKSLNNSRGLSAKSYDFISIDSARQWMEEAKSITGKFNIFLGVIGGISLLIGGIGTMNMMLTTISERTKEIGLRKAIGAQDSDITLQILLESIFVTLVGGIIGIIFTALMVLIANQFIPESVGFKLLVSPKVVSLSLFVSIVVGIVFGVSPAKKAAKLQPVDALRSD